MFSFVCGVNKFRALLQLLPKFLAGRGIDILRFLLERVPEELCYFSLFQMDHFPIFPLYLQNNKQVFLVPARFL